MNITEAHELFLAQHLGQYFVYQYSDLSYSPPCRVTTEYLYIWKSNPGNEPILLLRTEQLTDEEYLNVYRLKNNDFSISSKPYEDNKIKEGKRYIDNFWKYTKGYRIQFVAIYQYLLRIGILLPFTYINEENKPVTLSPDEIIKLGWVKIKE